MDRTKIDRGASRRSVAAAGIAALLFVSAGCTPLEKNQADRARDYASDVQRRLDQANRQIAQLQNEIDKDKQEVGRLEKQLAGNSDVRQIFEKRVENLRRENDRLQQELTATVMNAGGQKPADASSVLATVGGVEPAKTHVPPSVSKSLGDLAKSGQIVYDSQKRAIRFPSGMLFQGGGDQIRKDAEPLLRKLAVVLNGEQAAPFNVLIVGHTSSLAPIPKELLTQHPTDWHLAAHQAIAVQQFLEESGLSPTRAGIISYASYQPLVEGADDVARQKNERIEIFLLPPDQHVE